jgi:2-keto-4-pentenoate hydratase
MAETDPSAIAREMLRAFLSGDIVPALPSSQGVDLAGAYAVEKEFARLRRQSGRETVGVKVGFANKAVLRALKLETIVWAHMYDDTVHYAPADAAELVLPPHRAPKIEPEIVFKLKQPIPSGGLDAAAVLQHVEWLSIGFEIIDCPFPNWEFKPPDFVAAFGLHLALVVGRPFPVEPDRIAALTDALATFKLRLSRNRELVEEGSGKNSLRSPALCLAELAGAVLHQTPQDPLAAGSLVSTGTLTAGHRIQCGETWSVVVEGLRVPGLSLHLVSPDVP